MIKIHGPTIIAVTTQSVCNGRGLRSYVGRSEVVALVVLVVPEQAAGRLLADEAVEPLAPQVVQAGVAVHGAAQLARGGVVGLPAVPPAVARLLQRLACGGV